MTTYHVTARCTLPHYTTFEVQADTLEDALAGAKVQAADEYPEPCNGASCEWDEFEIRPEDGSANGMSHLEPSRLAANAADDLLQALIEVSLALKHHARWQSTMPAHLAEVVEAAIRKATQQ
jgi:hypothetical protein